MQIEGTKLIFIMNYSVLHFFKFASRMPQIAQILVSTFKIFWEGGGEGGHCGGGGWGGGHAPRPPRGGGMPPDPPRNVLFVFSLAIPGSVKQICP